jgi:hypothetical protein
MQGWTSLFASLEQPDQGRLVLASSAAEAVAIAALEAREDSAYAACPLPWQARTIGAVLGLVVGRSIYRVTLAPPATPLGEAAAAGCAADLRALLDPAPAIERLHPPECGWLAALSAARAGRVLRT